MHSRTCMTDAAQFTETYRQHSLPIYRFALHMSGSSSVADEVTQDTFMVLIHQPGSFDAKRGAMGGFLYGVARNLVRRHLEQGRKFRCVDDADEEDYATDEDLLGDLTRRQSIQALQEAVLCLPPKYREAVVLCDLQELSYEAAAAVVGCAVGTIRSRLHRARTLLASKMRVRCAV
jgi:RNA polymerase sigma-70 factor (ECF subfamily)